MIRIKLTPCPPPSNNVEFCALITLNFLSLRTFLEGRGRESQWTHLKYSGIGLHDWIWMEEVSSFV